MIKDCAGLLKNDGLFYCSAIEDDYEKSGYETSSDGRFKMYVYYHEADFLEASLKESGFELFDVKRKIYPKPGGVTAMHLILIARKNAD